MKFKIMSSTDTQNYLFKKNYFYNLPSDTHIFSKALKIINKLNRRNLQNIEHQKTVQGFQQISQTIINYCYSKNVKVIT